MTSEDMWSELSQKLAIVSENVPTVTLKTTRDGTIIGNTPWNRPCLRASKKSKDKFWNIFDQYPTAKNFRLAIQKQNEFQGKLEKCMMGYERRITSNMKTNP